MNEQPANDSQPGRDIIVIGASAGGVDTLQRLVRLLPADIPASVFIVLHVAAKTPLLLPSILDGKLPVTCPVDHAKIERGVIYVAPPDHHLLVFRDNIRVVRGPKENRHRPAIDPLFRSAAWAFGPRVVAVVLTGTMSDGTAGLWAVKTCGGATIVQDPSEAIFPQMPMNALSNVEIDYTLRIEDIALLLDKLARQPAPDSSGYTVPQGIKTETEFAVLNRSMVDMNQLGNPTALTCPNCHGSLWEIDNGPTPRYRCHVGHAFSADSLLEEQSEAIEKALYTALAVLEEKAATLRRLAGVMGPLAELRDRYLTDARDMDQSAERLRELIKRREA